MNKKLVSVLMVVVMLVAVLSTTVSATASFDTTAYGSVADCTNPNSLHSGVPNVTIKNNGTATISVYYNSADLKIVPKAAADGKNDAAWIGITVTPPAGTTHYKEANDEYISAKPTTFDRYFKISLDDLKAAKAAGKHTLEFKKVYTWYSSTQTGDKPTQTNEGTTQTIYIYVNLDEVRLYDDGNVLGTQVDDENLLFNGATTQKPSTQDPADDPADKPATKPSTSDKDEEPKTGITATAIVATATVAMISLAGVAISKK